MKLWLFLMVWLLAPVQSWAVCELRADGNYYTDEDPFVDAANHDFRLKEGACGIDLGATLPEVTHDFDGVKRPQGRAYDIGAFEFKRKDKRAPKHPQSVILL
jgi:hypothetical protein